jgi:hypothetical protein
MFAEKEAVGQRAKETQVNENEHGDDAEASVRQPAGIAVAVSLPLGNGF